MSFAHSEKENLLRTIRHFIDLNQELGEQEKETLKILAELHSIQNDPSTRDSESLMDHETCGPSTKARYIEQKAISILSEREDKANIHVEYIEAVDPITGSKTYNVVVTLANGTIGPVVDIIAHHDTIDAKDYSLSVLQENGENMLFGRTLQDDTIHAAALLASLKYLKVPESGKTRLVFTDYEENGCRGSSALIEKLLDGIKDGYQYAVVALESVMGNLAYGHRGKFSAFAESNVNGSPSNAYKDWYERLAWVQHEVDINSGTSELGKTAGTSTFGEIKNGKLYARLDFRTNSVMTPERVEGEWGTAISNDLKFSSNVVNLAKKSINNQSYTINISDDTITIKSGNIPTHPSSFNPENDGTVMPVIYLLLCCISDDDVEEITWGDPKKQNSNPMIGIVKFKKNLPYDLTAENLIAMMKSVEFVRSIEPSSSPISLNHVDKSDCMETNLRDGVFDSILGKFNDSLRGQVENTVEKVTVSYMTDAARIFNRAQQKEHKAYGMVFGIGDPKYLHKTEFDVKQNERLSAKDVILAIRGLILLPQIIHQVFGEQEF